MISKITEFLETRRYWASLFMGAIFNFAFAPFFIWSALISIAVFIYIIEFSESKLDAFKTGYIFGFSYFVCNLYWISIGVSVYFDQFWWAIPFALFGLPLFLAIYFGFVACVYFAFRETKLKILLFSCIWIIAELLRSYLFTGFPWSLVAYSFANSLNIIQITSLFGCYFLGALIIVTFGSLYYLLSKEYKYFSYLLILLIFIWGAIYFYGVNRVNNNPTEYTNLKFRLVQPSIKQSDKWTIDRFWQNFETHEFLSLKNIGEFNPDFIVWPEAAVTAEPFYVQVNNALKLVVSSSDAILITGGVTNNLAKKDRKSDKYYASIYAVNHDGKLLFDYHKSHLVPFGEYVPFSLPFKKLTPGSTAFTAGTAGFNVNIDRYNLNIRPLLCYEIIFPDQVRMSNKDADLFLNLTNDAYYGDSSGPYQHFYTSRMRSVENGLPQLRVANNGISGVFDSVGRIISSTNLNEITYIDTYLPTKLSTETNFAIFGNKFVYLYLIAGVILSIIFPLRDSKK